MTNLDSIGTVNETYYLMLSLLLLSHGSDPGLPGKLNTRTWERCVFDGILQVQSNDLLNRVFIDNGVHCPLVMGVRLCGMIYRQLGSTHLLWSVLVVLTD